jgi:hypothetical protein
MVHRALLRYASSRLDPAHGRLLNLGLLARAGQDVSLVSQLFSSNDILMWWSDTAVRAIEWWVLYLCIGEFWLSSQMAMEPLFLSKTLSLIERTLPASGYAITALLLPIMNLLTCGYTNSNQKLQLNAILAYLSKLVIVDKVSIASAEDKV